MIEAAEFATPTQRQLYDHYREIHLKFFPPPSAPAVRPPPPPVIAAPLPEPSPPPPPLPITPVALSQTRTRMRLIERAVCRYYKVTKIDLRGQRRTPEYVRPRHVFCLICSHLTLASLPMIGRFLNGRDHTTILHAIRRMEERTRYDGDLADRVRALETKLKNEFSGQERGTCTARYVQHHRVVDYLLLGWMHAANLNEYAALMIWPCSCPFVEPKQ
jgi:hypothetical protein